MFKKTLLLISTLLFTLPAMAEQLLDEPDVTAAGDQADIRINFSTPIKYIRHFPESIGDTLRIFIEVDPCVVAGIRNQESKNSQPNGLVNPFVITFPELIDASTGAGGSVCSTDNKRYNINKTILVRFESWTPYKVRLGDDNHSVIVTVAQRAGAEVKVERPKLKVAVPAEGASAEQLLKSAKAAMAAGEYDSAIEMLNRALNMPPNKFSQDAQEQVGMARELNRDLTKAKVEYELYLKLYPNTDGAARVAKRLAGINAGKPTVASSVPKAKKAYKEGSEVTTFGSLSQYYYGSRTNSSSTTGGVKTNTNTTDQTALVTSFDITSKWHHNQYDDKIVIRDAETHNFRPGDHDANRLTSAYWEHEDKDIGFSTRLGRQPGNSQGILGRFDGAFGRYTINPNWKVTAVAGVPDNGVHSKILTNRYFYGSALEFSSPNSSVSGDVYAIQQIADGMAERRAVGTELRYFKGSVSGFGLIDYDTLYNAVNIAMLQGNWTSPFGVNFNALLDHRKSPILYGETGLATVSPAASSVSDLRKTLTNSQIYKNISAYTAETDTALLGATKQINPQWQVGGDVRVNRTSATQNVFDSLGAIVQPARAASGNTYTYSLQAIGTNTIFKDDTSVINGSFIDDPTFNGQTFGVTNLATFRTKFRVDTSFNLFHSLSNTNLRTVKMTPAIRLAYQWRENTAFEAQLGVEKTIANDPTTSTRSLREFMFVGYRWDY